MQPARPAPAARRGARSARPRPAAPGSRHPTAGRARRGRTSRGSPRCALAGTRRPRPAPRRLAGGQAARWARRAVRPAARRRAAARRGPRDRGGAPARAGPGASRRSRSRSRRRARRGRHASPRSCNPIAARYGTPAASITSRAPVARSTTTATAATSAPTCAQRLDRLERRAAGGGGVLEHDHALARDIRALDLLAAAVVLRLLAHDERVVGETARGTLVQHRGGDGVGAHGHAADGGHVGHVGDEVEHDLADERGDPVVEAHLAQVDVVRRLLAARQREVAVEDRVGGDVVDELLACVGHPNTLRRACWTVRVGSSSCPLVVRAARRRCGARTTKGRPAGCPSPARRPCTGPEPRWSRD